MKDLNEKELNEINGGRRNQLPGTGGCGNGDGIMFNPDNHRPGVHIKLGDFNNH